MSMEFKKFNNKILGHMKTFVLQQTTFWLILQVVNYSCTFRFEYLFMSNQHLWQLIKSKSCGPFWSYQLNSTANPFTSKIGPNGLLWQCCLAGSSKMAPRILIFSIAMGAKPSFQLKSIATWAPAFFMHNNSFIATVKVDTHKSEKNIIFGFKGCFAKAPLFIILALIPVGSSIVPPSILNPVPW